MGQRLAIAATAEELTRRRSSKAKSKEQNEHELKLIVQVIRKLLTRIEDAVPLINLAITTSGASLSTNLPSTISPSRLLQASTFLTAGDTQYSMKSSEPVQIGPAFTLSMYMLFLGHLRPQNEEDVRQSTWKEVIHKARVKLVRVPLDSLYRESKRPIDRTNGQPVDEDSSGSPVHRSVEEEDYHLPQVEAAAKADQYAYQLVIIEDFDDDRMHTFDDTDVHPGPYDGVETAGIRENLSVHEISKIFYADTGKILNIGSEGEANSPVLLLKRDANAILPRRMMESFSEDQPEAYDDDTFDDDNQQSSPNNHDRSQHQSHIDAQLDREHSSSSLIPLPSSPSPPPFEPHNPWCIPADLDPEWVAFEVYTEAPDSDTESIPDSEIPSLRPMREPSLDRHHTTALAHLNLSHASTPASHANQAPQLTISPSTSHLLATPTSTLPAIRTSLSLLETLLRLCSLQQFQQQSHLAITDELLNFFLSDSNASTTGAGADSQERKRTRGDARRRVGFDPYDESPVKRRGEEYQYQTRYEGDGGGSQALWDRDHGYDEYGSSRPEYAGERDWTTPSTPSLPAHPYPRHHHPSRANSPATSPLLLKHRAQSSSSPSRGPTPEPSSYADPRPHLPSTPSGGGKGRPGVLKRDDGGQRRGSPLAKIGTGLEDEGLGTSPGSEFDGGDEEGKG